MNRFGRLLPLAIVVLASMAGCAAPAPPSVSADLLSAVDGADPARSLALMREQG